MPRERDGRGQYKSGMDAEDALVVFDRREDLAEPVVAEDVYEEMDWSRRTVHNKLSELVEREILKTRKVGPSGRVWWIPVPADGSKNKARNKSRPTSKEQIVSTDDVIEYAGSQIPGRSDTVQKNRAEAVLTAYKYLQEKGRATRKEIREYTYNKHPIEDSTENHTGAESQWINYLREGLQKLPHVEPSSGAGAGGIWNYIDPSSELAKQLDVDIDEWVSEVDVTGEGVVADRQRALIQIAYEYLKEQGSAEKQDFKEALPNYTSQYMNFDGLWSYSLKDGLKQGPNVEPPGPGYKTWQYVDDQSLDEELADVEIEDWVDVEGRGIHKKEREALVQMAYNYLRDEGEAKRSDFKKELPENTGGYRRFEGLWQYCMADALKDAPHVEVDQPNGLHHIYRYGSNTDEDVPSTNS